MKHCLSTMIRMYFTWWSSTAKAWFLLKSTIIYMTRNCWSLFAVSNIDDSSWNVALKIFMKNKQLSQCQVNYLNILSKFNFQIIFKSGKMNTKVDALTWMFLANVSESAKRFEDRFQTILISDRVDILSIDLKLSANSKSEVNLYQRV